MKTQPDREALQQLIRVLHEAESKPSEQFDMDFYKIKLPRELLAERHMLDKPECGFAACAYGHALHDPWFMARHNVAWQSNEYGISLVPLLDGRRDPIVAAAIPTASRPTAASGIRDQVFGLHKGQFDYIFMPSSYEDDEGCEISDVRPHHVIDHVEELLAELATQKEEEEDNG